MDYEAAAQEIPDLLSEYLQLPVRQVVEQRKLREEGGTVWTPDLVVELDGLRFLVEYKHRSRAEQVGQAIQFIQSGRSQQSQALPLLVVPFMGEIGQKLCERAGISWMDLSGNAWIHHGSVHVTIRGRENKFKKRGRQPNPFAPKSARIVRILLVEYPVKLRQQELANDSGVDPGYVSRIVRRLMSMGLLTRSENGEVAVRDPDLLLDAWSNAYDLSDHHILKGHLAVRTPHEAISRLIRILEEARIDHALTGLPSAWLYSPHAGYRLVTLYVSNRPQEQRLAEIGWRDQKRGSNVWLIEPKDPGVFYGSNERGGFRCVSAVQTYLDLKSLPERAEEAANALREQWLRWDDGRAE